VTCTTLIIAVYQRKNIFNLSINLTFPMMKPPNSRLLPEIGEKPKTADYCIRETAIRKTKTLIAVSLHFRFLY